MTETLCTMPRTSLAMPNLGSSFEGMPSSGGPLLMNSPKLTEVMQIFYWHSNCHITGLADALLNPIEIKKRGNQANGHHRSDGGVHANINIKVRTSTCDKPKVGSQTLSGQFESVQFLVQLNHGIRGSTNLFTDSVNTWILIPILEIKFERPG